MRTLLLATLALTGLALVPPAAASSHVQPQCAWEAGFAQLVYDATLGIVHPHDGAPLCTVHVHLPTLFDCAWNPAFADLVYSASQGTLHPHDGGVCWIHPHLP